MDVGLLLKFRNHENQQNNFQKLETAWGGAILDSKPSRETARIRSYPSSCRKNGACKRRFDWAHPVHVEAHACCTTRLRCDKPQLPTKSQWFCTCEHITKSHSTTLNFQQHVMLYMELVWKLILINFCVQTFEANFFHFGAPFWVIKNSANLGTSISVVGSKARP